MSRYRGIGVFVCFMLLACVGANASPPDSSGVVIRYDIENACAIFCDFGEDASAGRELCVLYCLQDDLAGCTAATEFVSGNVLEVDTLVALHQLISADNLFVWVYDDRLPFEPFSCDYLDGTSGRMIAAGRGNFRQTDNDLFIAGPGANSYGTRGQGTRLTITDEFGGGNLNMNSVHKFLFDPDGTFRPIVRKINLTNDPR